MSVADQQLLDTVSAEIGISRGRRDGMYDPSADNARDALAALAERLTDLRAENDRLERYVATWEEWFCFLENDVEVARRAEAAEKRLADATEAAIQGVLTLMSEANTHPDRGRVPGAIVPVSNGYSCWFTAHDSPGTYPLSAVEIAERVTRLAAPQKEAVKPPKELPPMWESTDGGYNKEEPQKEAGAIVIDPCLVVLESEGLIKESVWIKARKCPRGCGSVCAERQKEASARDRSAAT